MVGAKSVGCTTCKRRKIKCDERFPICANCERAKRHCPGPKARFIRFIGPGNEEHMRGDTVQITMLSRPPSYSRSESLAVSLACRLDGIKEIGYQLQALGNFFPYIVPRLGHNPALDAAVKCLLDAHQNFLTGNRTSCDDDVKSYNYAMSLIRTDLDHLQKRTPSETICASMLLCRYEVLKLNLKAWFTHSGGVAALIEARGPERITSEFDLALFRDHYGSIISTSVFSDKHCFLTAPAWEAVRIKCEKRNGDYHPHLSERATFATLPRILQRLRCETASSVIYEARRFKERLSRFTPSIEQDLQDPAIVSESAAPLNSYMSTYYTYTMPFSAMRFCIYWAMTIIANSILMSISEVDISFSLTEESQSAAAHICKSIENFRLLKPLGAHSMMVILSTAYGISDMEIKGRLEGAYRDLLEKLYPESRKMCGEIMQLVFDTLTGRREAGNGWMDL